MTAAAAQATLLTLVRERFQALAHPRLREVKAAAMSLAVCFANGALAKSISQGDGQGSGLARVRLMVQQLVSENLAVEVILTTSLGVIT